jgi:hypothetical protein
VPLIRSVGGSRGRIHPAGLAAPTTSHLATRPGTTTPAGFIGRAVAGLRGRRVAYNTMLAHPIARAFPGEGDHGYPAELNNIAPRIVRRRAEPHTAFRIQHGADMDPSMPALDLGLPWRAAPDSPVRRPYGPGTNRGPS